MANKSYIVLTIQLYVSYFLMSSKKNALPSVNTSDNYKLRNIYKWETKQ